MTSPPLLTRAQAPPWQTLAGRQEQVGVAPQEAGRMRQYGSGVVQGGAPQLGCTHSSPLVQTRAPQGTGPPVPPDPPPPPAEPEAPPRPPPPPVPVAPPDPAPPPRPPLPAPPV